MKRKSLSVLLATLLLLTCIPLGAVGVSAETSGNYTYTVSDGEATITKYNGSDRDVTIPDTLGGYPVTTIGKSAFEGSTHLGSVVIPDSVTTIGQWAFYNCAKLNSVIIGDSVTTIGLAAFFFCESLTSVVIPDSVTTIDIEAFSWCPSLTSVIIGNGVTTIGDWAFGNCESLTDVYYAGTKAQADAIVIGIRNAYLLNATWHYPSDPISDDVQHSVMDTENGNGLAFRFGLSAQGVAMKDGTVADLTEATVNYLGTDCKLVGMGAVLTNSAAVGETAFTLADVNGNNVLNIPAVYLQEAEADYCAFATRIINIPNTQLERTIYARPYYIVEVDGEEIVVYGDTDSASCAEYM